MEINELIVNDLFFIEDFNNKEIINWLLNSPYDYL